MIIHIISLSGENNLTIFCGIGGSCHCYVWSEKTKEIEETNSFRCDFNDEEPEITSIRLLGDFVWTGGIDGNVRTWSRPSLTLVKEFSHPDATKGKEEEEEEEGEQKKRIKKKVGVGDLDYHSASSLVSVCSHDGKCRVFDYETKNLLHTLNAFQPGYEIRSCRFEGPDLIVGERLRKKPSFLSRWSLPRKKACLKDEKNEGKDLLPVRPFSQMIRHFGQNTLSRLTFNPSYYSIHRSRSPFLIETSLRIHHKFWSTMIVDGTDIVIGFSDGAIACFDSQTNSLVGLVNAHSFPVTGLFVREKRIFSSSADRSSAVNEWPTKKSCFQKILGVLILIVALIYALFFS